MRKITFLLSFLTFSIGFAQVTLEDFEGTTDVTPSNGLGSANIIANTTGSGTAGNVLEVISAASLFFMFYVIYIFLSIISSN